MESVFKDIAEADIPGLKYQIMDWDVAVNGKPYQVIKAYGFVHTIGGHLDWGSGNDFWAYPLGEEMTVGNLMPYDGYQGACWGLVYSPINKVRSKSYETSIETGRTLVITRNGVPFYDGFMTFHEAIAYIKDGKLDGHPLDLNKRDFDKKCVGRKVWWKDQPAVVKEFANGRACVFLTPEEGRFKCPKSYDEEEVKWWETEYGKELFESIFSENIYWFRD